MAPITFFAFAQYPVIDAFLEIIKLILIELFNDIVPFKTLSMEPVGHVVSNLVSNIVLERPNETILSLFLFSKRTAE